MYVFWALAEKYKRVNFVAALRKTPGHISSLKRLNDISVSFSRWWTVREFEHNYLIAFENREDLTLACLCVADLELLDYSE